MKKIIIKISIYYAMISLVIIFGNILYDLWFFDMNIISKNIILIVFLVIFSITSKYSFMIFNHYFISKDEHYIKTRKEIQDNIDKKKKFPLSTYIIGGSIVLTLLTSSIIILLYAYFNISNIFIIGAVFCAYWFIRDIFLSAYKYI